MHLSVLQFTQRVISKEDIEDKYVLEVGSRNINGSVRPYIMSLKPKTYIGIDMMDGIDVDIAMNADRVLEVFGEKSVDVLISTEMMEHVLNWREIVLIMKKAVKPEGILLVTTRSKGFPKHDYPCDYWRYEIEDFKKIFEDFEIINLEKDPQTYGVFLKAQKPINFKEKNLDNIKLYKI